MTDDALYVNPEGNMCMHHPDDPAHGPRCVDDGLLERLDSYRVSDGQQELPSPTCAEAAARIRAQAEEIARLGGNLGDETDNVVAEQMRAEKAEAERDEWQGRAAWLANVLDYKGPDATEWQRRAAAHWRDLTAANAQLRNDIKQWEGRAGWLADFIIGKWNGTPEPELWVKRSSQYYRDLLARTECAEDASKALREEVRALKADAERLEWLDRDDIDIYCGVSAGMPYVEIITCGTAYNRPNIREAIDAARAKGKE